MSLELSLYIQDLSLAQDFHRKLFLIKNGIIIRPKLDLCGANVTNNTNELEFNLKNGNKRENFHYKIIMNWNLSQTLNYDVSIPRNGIVPLHSSDLSIKVPNCSMVKLKSHTNSVAKFQLNINFQKSSYLYKIDSSLMMTILFCLVCPSAEDLLESTNVVKRSIWVVFCVILLTVFIAVFTIFVCQKLYRSKRINMRIKLSKHPKVIQDVREKKKHLRSYKITFKQLASRSSTEKGFVQNDNQNILLIQKNHNANNQKTNDIGINNFTKNNSETKDADDSSYFTNSSLETHQTGATPIVNRRVKDPLQIINEIQTPRTEITLKSIIVEGTFCQMYEGVMLGTGSTRSRRLNNVLIKTLADTSTPAQASVLLKDAVLLAGLRHRNLCALVRAAGATYSNGGIEMIQPPWLLYPLCRPGNLKLIFQQRIKYETFLGSCGALTFSTPQLTRLAIQILKAVKYLHDRCIIHKDIAARNCFLDGNDRIKLCDSALSRDLFPEDYHCLGDNENRPVKWLSPEALVQRRFSRASDIWAFGVFCWELVTRAALPYADTDPFEMPTLLRSGYRLPQPSNCPDGLWNIIYSCWEADFKRRPILLKILQNLKEFQKILSDFV